MAPLRKSRNSPQQNQRFTGQKAAISTDFSKKVRNLGEDQWPFAAWGIDWQRSGTFTDIRRACNLLGKARDKRHQADLRC